MFPEVPSKENNKKIITIKNKNHENNEKFRSCDISNVALHSSLWCNVYFLHQ